MSSENIKKSKNKQKQIKKVRKKNELRDILQSIKSLHQDVLPREVTYQNLYEAEKTNNQQKLFTELQNNQPLKHMDQGKWDQSMFEASEIRLIQKSPQATKIFADQMYLEPNKIKLMLKLASHKLKAHNIDLQIDSSFGLINSKKITDIYGQELPPFDAKVSGSKQGYVKCFANIARLHALTIARQIDRYCEWAARYLPGKQILVILIETVELNKQPWNILLSKWNESDYVQITQIHQLENDTNSTKINNTQPLHVLPQYVSKHQQTEPLLTSADISEDNKKPQNKEKNISKTKQSASIARMPKTSIQSSVFPAFNTATSVTQSIKRPQTTVHDTSSKPEKTELQTSRSSSLTQRQSIYKPYQRRRDQHMKSLDAVQTEQNNEPEERFGSIQMKTIGKRSKK